MALKSFYVIDGKRWVPVGHAATLLGTSAVKIKQMMGDGTLDWRQLRIGSTTFLVDEQTVLSMRQPRQAELKAAKRRAKTSLPTARQRRTSQLDVLPASSLRRSDIFVRSWDPSPGPEGLARGRKEEP